MKLSQLIRKLEKIKKEHGDLEVMYEEIWKTDYIHCVLYKLTKEKYDLAFTVENRKQTDRDTFDYCDEYLLINGRCLK